MMGCPVTPSKTSLRWDRRRLRLAETSLVDRFVVAWRCSDFRRCSFQRGSRSSTVDCKRGGLDKVEEGEGEEMWFRVWGGGGRERISYFSCVDLVRQRESVVCNSDTMPLLHSAAWPAHAVRNHS